MDSPALRRLEQNIRSRSYAEHCAFQVRWYRRMGAHPDRIAKDSRGVEYVIGDWSWNSLHPDRREIIDHRLEQLKY